MAWCELRGDYRTFRIDRIQDFKVLDATFVETEQISLQTLMQRYEPSEDCT